MFRVLGLAIWVLLIMTDAGAVGGTVSLAVCIDMELLVLDSLLAILRGVG